MSRRFLVSILTAVFVPAVLAGTATTANAAPAEHATPAGASGGDRAAHPAGGAHLADGLVVTGGVFGEYNPDRNATTYDPALVPRGAKAYVAAAPVPAGGTTVTLLVSGLVPEREYGAHVHTDPCGPTGKAAGPHFQDTPAPAGHKHDPEYVNADNEVWLDFTTSRIGTAHSSATVDWRVGDRQARSVVIHERHTATSPGEAGKAGDRLACINVNF